MKLRMAGLASGPAALGFTIPNADTQNAGLVQGCDGKLYGTTALGRIYGGTVFSISSTGSLTIRSRETRGKKYS